MFCSPNCFPYITVSRSVLVTPLLPASPSVIIVTDRSSRLCSDNSTRTILAGEPNVLTCTASQARPPAILNWIVPDDLTSNQQDQTDVVKGNSYTSQKVVTITPSVNDQGKHISCFASHQTLQSDRQCIVFLNVHVLPSSTTIFQSGNGKDYRTSPTFIYVQEGSSASITCQSIRSRPAVKLTWSIDDPDIPPRNESLSKTRNPVDGSLFDTKSTFKLHLYRKYQGLILWCYVYLGEDFVERQFVTISTYAPPDEVVMTLPAELKEGIEATVICKVANGYPAPCIYWYIGSRNVTGHSSLNISENDAGRYDAESTLTFIPKRLDHGKHLLCLAVLPTLSTTWSVNDSMVLYITGALFFSIVSI
ncbi:nephrin-like [Lytechinus variegatus]|uniref:nephrin-like n=1 Tax=Lytechinus variegatus TaxID=7654 RepID=UPI001BB25E96|nr:nephrin-like [Lytechinus variegatus]